MCVIDFQERFKLLNPAFEKALGFLAEESIDTSFCDYIHPEDQDLAAHTMQDAIHTAKAATFACRFRCADSTHKWLLWRIFPQPTQVLLAIAKDITPFQQMEDIERARNTFAEALLDSVLAINSSLRLDEVFQRILSNIGRVADYDHVNIMLIEDGIAQIAAYQNATGIDTDDQVVRALRMTVADYRYLTFMTQTNQPVIVYDVDTDPYWERIPGFHISGCYLGSPITVENTVIGFLNVINTRKDFYTSIHLRQLYTFANHVGIAINNANLYEQAKQVAALEERHRLARELHDSVSQSLFAAHALATLTPKILEKKPGTLLEHTTKISQRIRGALDQMRMILIELYPDAITNTELGILLKQLCLAASESSGIPIHITTTSKILLKREAQLAYYRIAQELLHNVEKHAHASRVAVSLEQDGDTIILQVEDNGIGFDLHALPPAHFGIKNLFDRAHSVGATLHIESQRGKGTHVVLEGKII